MQHAYLKGKSAETALHDLVYKIDGSLARKEFALGVFLDAAATFVNTSFEWWIDFMLSSRSVFVDIRGVGVHLSV
jgi:hypothetical protein